MIFIIYINDINYNKYFADLVYLLVKILKNITI